VFSPPLLFTPPPGCAAHPVGNPFFRPGPPRGLLSGGRFSRCLPRGEPPGFFFCAKYPGNPNFSPGVCPPQSPREKWGLPGSPRFRARGPSGPKPQGPRTWNRIPWGELQTPNKGLKTPGLCHPTGFMRKSPGPRGNKFPPKAPNIPQFPAIQNPGAKDPALGALARYPTQVWPRPGKGPLPKAGPRLTP